MFGQRAPQTPLQVGFPIHYIGHLQDAHSLQALCSAADAFVIPSRQVNLPEHRPRSPSLLIPALIICFKAIEESFAPDIDVLAEPMPVVVAEAETKRKPRKARRRRPSAQTLAAIEAIA